MSAATQPFQYGGNLWCYTIDYWAPSENLARANSTWLLHRLNPDSGVIEWSSEPISLAEWVLEPPPGASVGSLASYGPAEPIQRSEIDGDIQTKTPHLLSGSYSLLGCTHQGALICHNLAGSPVEAWRKDGRQKDGGGKQACYLPLGVDPEGRFICAFREISWTIDSVLGYYWPSAWNPGDPVPPKQNYDFPAAESAPCGLIALDPETGEEAWRWEVPETGTLREWERRDEGEYRALVVDDEDWMSGDTRRPRYALIEQPPGELSGRPYFTGGLIVEGPAIYYNRSSSPPYPLQEDGAGPAVHYWDDLPHGARPYDAQAGLHTQWEPDIDTVANSSQMGQDGTGPASWLITWHSLYLGKVQKSVTGGSPSHSLTSTCVTPHGIICGPTSTHTGHERAGDPLVWRCVTEGEAVWTTSLAAHGADYARLASAPLCVGDRVYTVIWEYDSGGDRRPPVMVVLSASTGEILAVDPLPEDLFTVADEALRVGFELVYSNAIFVGVSNKLFRYN